jgi:hypothetical protein
MSKQPHADPIPSTVHIHQFEEELVIPMTRLALAVSE